MVIEYRSHCVDCGACCRLGRGFGAGAWFVAMHNDANDVSRPGTSTVADTSLDKSGSVPQPVAEHHGNSPDCPDTDCIAMLVNGDLLFHESLWNSFRGANTSATDGTAFNFDPLFEPMRQYIQASDIAVCNFETPIAQRGGPYSAYPIINIPPEVADAARNVGYNACTHATNHSWDQGSDGIARLWDTLEADGIAQTGSYKTEEDSLKPLVIDSPTGGDKLGLVAGTVSINGMTATMTGRLIACASKAIRITTAISSDHPIGTCWTEVKDAQVHQRISDVIYAMGADQNVVKEWNIPKNRRSKPHSEFPAAVLMWCP